MFQPRGAQMVLAWMLGGSICGTAACGQEGGRYQVQGESLAPTSARKVEDRDGEFDVDDLLLEAWTEFLPASDTRMIHVSNSSGNDDWSGLTPETPVRSLARGYELMRDQHPDWLLLKRGDEWRGESLGMWKKSGRSPSEPMLISTFGDDEHRPLLRTDGGHGFQTKGHETTKYVAIVGLAFACDRRTPEDNCVGVRWLVSGGDFLIEDCLIRGYSTNVVIQNVGSDPLENIRIRRSILIDAYHVGGHSQGLFCKRIRGVLVDGCIFDHNGWNEDIVGAGRTIFNHNIYIQNDCSDLTVINNIVARGASHGLQARPGGVIEGNVFLRNAIALLVGGGDDPNEGGVTGFVRGNLILHGDDISASLPRGHAITLQNIASMDLSDNVISSDASASPFGHGVYFQGDRSNEIGVHNTMCRDNLIYNWRGGFKFRGMPGANLSQITITGNFIQDRRGETPLLKHDQIIDPSHIAYSQNTYFSTQSKMRWFQVAGARYGFSQWANVSGDTGSEDFAIGRTDDQPYMDRFMETLRLGSSEAEYMALLRRQRRGNWRVACTAAPLIEYFKSGFMPACQSHQ